LWPDSPFPHDIFVSVFRKGHASEAEQVKVARISVIIFGIVAIGLGILFKGQNVAFMVGLAFAIAASGNFPALFMSIIWKKCSTAGAVTSILVGSLSATLLIILSPTVWVDIFHNQAAIFPLKNPAIVSLPLSFICGIIVSLMTPDKEAEQKFEDEKLRTYLGIGAE
jgi:cation/acetate symporter